MKKLLLTLLILLCLCTQAWAADYTVSTATTTVDGDTVCGGSACTSADKIIILKGARGDLLIKDFDGDGSYIEIVNEDSDAKVIITSDDTVGYGALSFDNCKYIDFKGNNDSDYTYGIKVIDDGGAPATTVYFYNNCDNIKFSYVEISNEGRTGTDGIGLQVPGSTGGSSVIFDAFEIHHLYIHETRYAAMYLGRNNPSGGDEPYIANFSVHDCLLENIGAYGITIKGVHGTSSYVNIYNNTIKNTNYYSGFSGAFSHGIHVQYYYGTTYASIYNNWIEKTYGPGIRVTDQEVGTANHQIYNNILVGCGTGDEEAYGHAIVLVSWSTPQAEFFQNTIIQPKRYALYKWYYGNGADFRDNIVAGAVLGEYGVYDEDNELVISSANTVGTVAAQEFTTWSDDSDYSNDDFSLQSDSPAVDASAAVGDSGAPALDYDSNIRSGTPDDGAYEYGGTQPPTGCNDISKDPNCVAWYEFSNNGNDTNTEVGTFHLDTNAGCTFAGAACADGTDTGTVTSDGDDELFDATESQEVTGDFTIAFTFSFAAELAGDDFDTLIGQWDLGENQRSWLVGIIDNGDADDTLVFYIGTDTDGDPSNHEGDGWATYLDTTNLDHNTTYRVVIVYDTDPADTKNSVATFYTYTAVDGVATGAKRTPARTDDDDTEQDGFPAAEISVFCTTNNDAASAGDTAATIYEAAIFNDKFTDAEAASFGAGEYAGSTAAVTSITTTADLTAAGFHSIYLNFNREVSAPSPGSPTIPVTYDYPVDPVTYTYYAMTDSDTAQFRTYAYAGYRQDAFVDAGIADAVVLPDGTTWTDPQDVAISLDISGLDTYPAHTVAIPIARHKIIIVN